MATVPTDFLDRAVAVAKKARSLDLPALNEANTKALLIEPILDALGWDVSDLDAVTREYKVYDGTFLDYALLVEAKAVLFCEAKPTGKKLDDPKWVSQTINYANNEGVVWCVLTDGLRWRVFKANEAVSMPKKLAFEITLDDLEQPTKRAEALRLFSCLTPAAVAEGDLSALGTQIFVDGRVRDVLARLVEDPPKRFVDLIRSEIGRDVNLTPADLRATLARSADAVVTALAALPSCLPSETTAEQATARSGPHPNGVPKKRRHRTSVVDLINAGLLQAGEAVHLTNHGRRIEGTITPDGHILTTAGAGAPSSTAAAAIGHGSWNGWDKWHVDRNGGAVPLTQLREQHQRSAPATAPSPAAEA